ncbi:Scr1 family TA system antitoxin-like transcriptional regulator [Streptomyces sp. V1I1]|uniref:Scr1 family TA system antitoxin-like transcriptional regulator n=1 Tax=Streptomyces sp. V1I1 TaxID=3042272 RepID=UPI0027D7F170|nr:Scr1 family TA system antitoxin-like transcriptional regulator [Streptomyces sp. V1I1]
MQALAARASGFLSLEAIATQLHAYEWEVVPGLLQTEAYVRAIHQRAHAGIGSTEIDRLVEVRMTRQQVLRRAQAPLKVTAIVNESVLRRRVGQRSGDAGGFLCAIQDGRPHRLIPPTTRGRPPGRPRMPPRVTPGVPAPAHARAGPAPGAA